MKSLDNVIDAILAHLRSWPAFYAAPEPDSVGQIPVDSPAEGQTPDGQTPDGRTPDGWIPQMPAASAAPVPGGRAWDGRPLSHRILGARTPDGRTPDGRTPDGQNPIGRCCYRVAPTEWGVSGLPAAASQQAEETPSRPDCDPPARQDSARRRSSSFLGASALPQPRGLLTCSPQAPERPRRAGGGFSLA